MPPKLKLAGVAATALVPVPDTGTCCGLPEALSVKFRVAVSVPVVVGLKMILAVQLAEAARVEPHVLLKTSKSEAAVPVKAMLLIEIWLLPVLVRVTTFCPPAWPMATLLQVTEVGETVACAAAVRPHPPRRQAAAISRSVLNEMQGKDDEESEKIKGKRINFRGKS